MILAQYALALEVILSLFTPLLICIFALRRLLLSRSFNRVIYGLVAGLTAVTEFGLLSTDTVPSILRSASPVYAIACVSVWIVVTTLGPSTRGVRSDA